MKITRKSFGLGLLGAATSLSDLVAQQGPKSESSETVARPRRKDGADADAELPKIPSRIKRPNEANPDVTIRTDVLTVNVDVAVLNNKGQFIPGIPKGNFRVLEDGVPQQLTNFSLGEAPMTVCMVIEWSNLFQNYYSYTWYQTLQASYGFLETLKPDDNVAIVAYDIRPEILSDFSSDKRKALEAMQRLRIAAFSEANLFDALTDTADRMSGIEGRKAIILLSSGIDTFSKLTLDKTRKSLQQSGVPVYSIGLMQQIRLRMEPYMGSIARLDFLQADNQLRTFSKETGGQSFFPRFEGELPSIYRAVSDSLRNQYSLAYQPNTQARDGKYRKLKVELVNPATNEPLRITDEKGKSMKYSVVAKAGYTAPREVE